MLDPTSDSLHHFDFSAVSYCSEGCRTERFLNRELSLLCFNERVLSLAGDDSIPLLERVRFLAIFSSNLDEFFMKRVGGLEEQVRAGVSPYSLDGRTPAEQLTAIRREVLRLVDKRRRIFEGLLRPALAAHGVVLLSWRELSTAEQEEARMFFRKSIFPLLTPLSVDPGHPFPFISNLSHSLALAVRQPGREEKFFARVKISIPVSQWIPLSLNVSPGARRFVSLQDVVSQNLDQLFPGLEILSCASFRLTRSSETDFADHDAEDLRSVIEEGLKRRRFLPPVRLEIRPDAEGWLLQCLTEELAIDPDQVYPIEGEPDFTSLHQIAALDIPRLKYRPWVPIEPPGLAMERDFFGVVRAHDLLVHHPFESFGATVARFMSEAADDPRVLAIKMTAYRIGDEDPLIPLLIRAAENGKQVVCLIELQAHFDEERNMRWAEKMETAGVHVVFGILGLKTHAKTLLIVRSEPDGVRCYAHIGTGNYHATTARLYTDLGLFTCSPAYTEELADFFNYLSGRSMKDDYRTLIVAPLTMRPRFLAMIKREIDNHTAGKPAHIIAKVNSLTDEEVCESLYRASQAGVPVDLVVRGTCCIRPGVPKLSENIRVLSVIGRLLEHSRIFYFRNGGSSPLDGEFYCGSADWMKRNLDNRVEIVVPIKDRALKEKCWEILEVIKYDEQQAWEMQPDGSYRKRHGSTSSLGTHEYLMEKALKEDASSKNGKRHKKSKKKR